MEYVFGSTLVCDTLDNAKKVAFDKQVMTKTVTLGGDIFDPQGTLSGGESVFLVYTHTQRKQVIPIDHWPLQNVIKHAISDKTVLKKGLCRFYRCWLLQLTQALRE